MESRGEELREEGEGTPKIFENHQIPKESILRRWYTQIRISHLYGSNQKSKISPGDGLRAELAKLHQ